MMRYYISPMTQRPQWAFPHFGRRMRWMEEHGDADYVPVDIFEEKDSYILSALVPGRRAEDIQISVEKDVLTLQSETGYERDEEKTYLMAERPTGEFRRSFQLPTDIDAEKIEAKLVDGILTVNIPKSEVAQPRNIKVN